jgi:hypothetical protein
MKKMVVLQKPSRSKLIRETSLQEKHSFLAIILSDCFLENAEFTLAAEMFNSKF